MSSRKNTPEATGTVAIGKISAVDNGFANFLLILFFVNISKDRIMI